MSATPDAGSSAPGAGALRSGNGLAQLNDDLDLRPGPRAPASLTMRQVYRLGALGLVLVLLGAAVGLATSLVLPTQYAARASILYPLTIEQPTGFLREDRNLSTQLVLITSRTVLGPVAAAEEMSIEDLEDAVSAAIVEGTEIIDVEVVDPSRERGVALADAVVREYLRVANDENQDSALAYVETELSTVADRMRVFTLSEAEVAALIQRQQSLFEQRDALLIGAAQARIAVEPYSDADRVGLLPGYAALTGALCGLLIAATTIALLARRWLR